MDNRDIMNLLTKPPALLMIIIAHTAGCLIHPARDLIGYTMWTGREIDLMMQVLSAFLLYGEYCLIPQKNIMLLGLFSALHEQVYLRWLTRWKGK